MGTRGRFVTLVLGVIVGIFGVGRAAAAQLQPGYAVATCFSDNQPAGAVIGVYDAADPVGKGAPLGATDAHWQGTTKFHWTRNQFLGDEVFGIALDGATPSPNVYVTSTAIYKSDFVPVAQTSPGTGRVFKILGGQAAGPVVVIATLPQDLAKPAGQGLGNIAYDPKFDQLFVSNFHDGKIYRLKTSGQILDAFDPFQPFGSYANTGGGFAPLGERVWGVGVFRDRLYFSLWGRDWGSAVSTNEIYSVALGAFGKPGGSVKNEQITTSMPVSDIEFAPDGRMLLAERSMRTFVNGATSHEAYTYAHVSQLFEYSLGTSGSWSPSGHVFDVGRPGPLSTAHSSAGGADYQCPEGRTGELVVATGDALNYPFNPGGSTLPWVYGLQLMPSTGGGKATSYQIDLDGLTGSHDKTQIGDVDVYNTCDRQCSELVNVEIRCATNAAGVPIPGKYTLSFQVRNRSAAPVYHALLVGLPGASTTHFTFPNGLAPGAVSGVLTTMITGGTAGQQLTFQVTLHDQELNECCATRHTITLPRCDCAQVLGTKGPYCKFHPFGNYSYTFTLQNLNPAVQPAYVVVVPETPSTAVISPPVSGFSGNTTSVPLTIGNVATGQQVCFLISLHTADFERCCSVRQCVTIPKCFDFPIDPIGDTHVSFEDAGLVLDESGGTPGCTLPLLPDTATFDLSWNEAEAAALPVGGTLEQSIQGTVDGSERTVARATTTRTATGAELRASFPTAGATRHRFEFFLDGERTGVVSGVGPDAPAICNGCGGSNITTDFHYVSPIREPFAPFPGSEPCDREGYTLRGDRCHFLGMTYKTANRFGIPDFPGIFLADEVRVFPEDGNPRADALTAAMIQAHGIPRLTLVDLSVQGDCNDNGIPDFDEIRTGAGRDLDRNGVLDACEALVPLTTDLATGVENGQPLAGGSEDRDWTLVSPGPPQAARVVARPSAAWAPALPGSRWVSVEPQTGRSLPGVRFLHFERTFCLSAGAKDLVLELSLRADDRAAVRLNGQTLAGPGGGFKPTLPPLILRRTGAAGDGLFRVGENRLEVEVRDPSGFFTGFDLAGSLTGATEVCLVP